MANRKTDDIDVEWLRAYLKRKYHADVLKKFDQDCTDYQAGDIIYDPLDLIFEFLQIHLPKFYHLARSQLFSMLLQEGKRMLLE